MIIRSHECVQMGFEFPYKYPLEDPDRYINTYIEDNTTNTNTNATPVNHFSNVSLIDRDVGNNSSSSSKSTSSNSNSAKLHLKNKEETEYDPSKYIYMYK